MAKPMQFQVMACAVARKEVKFYHVDLTSLKSTWHAQTEHQMKSVLRYVGKLHKVIVFVDEIDCFVGEFNRIERPNSTLLTEMLKWINGLETQVSTDQNQTIIYLCGQLHGQLRSRLS
jgi:SpoVK/Ycf46/Vps4 family AAA+-type ATPase